MPVQKANAVVSMYNYDRPSWTGLVYPTECYFPTWKVEEDHFTVKALVNAYEGLFGKAPVVDKWTFSTNGVSIMGRHGIPVIGFGPGKEPEAHAPNEKTWKSHLVTCAAMYAANSPRIGPILKMALSPRSGAEPWQLTP